MRTKLFLSILLSAAIAQADTNTTTASVNDADNSFEASLDYAQVTQVSAKQSANGSWCFAVSVRHNDQGWEHYADGWEVTDLDGNQLAYRLLAHPHDNEQPFIRSQCNIDIPKSQTEVIVRAKCTQHGYGGKVVTVDLTKTSGEDYTVKF